MKRAGRFLVFCITGGVGGLIAVGLLAFVSSLMGHIIIQSEYVVFAFISIVFGAVVTFTFIIADGAIQSRLYDSRVIIRAVLIAAAINAITGDLVLYLLDFLPQYDGSPNILFSLALTTAFGAGPGVGLGFLRHMNNRSIEIFALAGFIGSAATVMVPAVWVLITRIPDLGFQFELLSIPLAGIGTGAGIAAADLLCAKSHE